MIRIIYTSALLVLIALLLLPFQLIGILLNSRLQRIVPNLSLIHI